MERRCSSALLFLPYPQWRHCFDPLLPHPRKSRTAQCPHLHPHPYPEQRSWASSRQPPPADGQRSAGSRPRCHWSLPPRQSCPPFFAAADLCRRRSFVWIWWLSTGGLEIFWKIRWFDLICDLHIINLNTFGKTYCANKLKIIKLY